MRDDNEYSSDQSNEIERILTRLGSVSKHFGSNICHVRKGAQHVTRGAQAGAPRVLLLLFASHFRDRNLPVDPISLEHDFVSDC